MISVYFEPKDEELIREASRFYRIPLSAFLRMCALNESRSLALKENLENNRGEEHAAVTQSD